MKMELELHNAIAWQMKHWIYWQYHRQRAFEVQVILKHAIFKAHSVYFEFLKHAIFKAHSVYFE